MAAGRVQMSKRNSLIAVGVFIILAAVILGSYTVDKTVTSGDAYGFSIGESKELVANRLKDPNQNRNWRIAFIGDTPKTFSAIDVSDLETNDLPDNGVVSLRKTADNAVNTLRLTFSRGRLTELYRHRHLSEFP
jgi:hypothetical protein